jgi:hypothetical protein
MNMSQIYGDSLVITKQPTISSASTAYVAGDQVGAAQTLPCGHGADTLYYDGTTRSLGSPRNRAPVYLQSIQIVEQSTQQAGLDIFFFSTLPTTVADNAAADISDTIMSDYCIGAVRVASTDYMTMASNCVASKVGIGLLLEPVASGTVWAVPVIRSATTYTLASGLVFNYGFSREV